MTDAPCSLSSAVIGYSRAWFATDGPNRQIILGQGGELDPRLLRKFAREYEVNRGIIGWKQAADEAAAESKPTKDDIPANTLCKILNCDAKHRSNGLANRANYCTKIAAKAIKKKCCKKNKISAVTKFMWFLRPNGWTVYGNLAATGLGIRKNAQKNTRMLAFYEKLKELAFC